MQTHQSAALAPSQVREFQDIIYSHFAQHGRYFDWRYAQDPYHIVVSEIMLQQTQTHRVAHKFPQFLEAFPTFEALADASFSQVLTVWQGLGYNRRALALHGIAQRVVAQHGGMLPSDPEVLETFPGIGHATARSICAFAYNTPTAFIETNIRAVYIYFFFSGREVGEVSGQGFKVHDRDILPLVDATLDRGNAREWYYALMDYGVKLKKEFANPSRASAHHAVQSKFEGSDRQIRSGIVKFLLAHGPQGKEALLQEAVKISQDNASVVVEAEYDHAARVAKILEGLCRDGLVCCQAEIYRVA